MHELGAYHKIHRTKCCMAGDEGLHGTFLPFKGCLGRSLTRAQLANPGG